MKHEPIIHVSGAQISIHDQNDKEVVMWHRDEWIEDPSLVATISNTISLAHAEGVDYIKENLYPTVDYSTVIDGQPISITLNTQQDFYPDRDDIDELIIGLGTIEDSSSETVSLFIKKGSIVS